MAFNDKSSRRTFVGTLSAFTAALLAPRKLSLEFRVETFNAWNHAQFQNPNGSINSSEFGVVTSALPARIMQLGAKFNF